MANRPRTASWSSKPLNAAAAARDVSGAPVYEPAGGSRVLQPDVSPSSFRPRCQRGRSTPSHINRDTLGAAARFTSTAREAPLFPHLLSSMGHYHANLPVARHRRDRGTPRPPEHRPRVAVDASSLMPSASDNCRSSSVGSPWCRYTWSGSLHGRGRGRGPQTRSRRGDLGRHSHARPTVSNSEDAISNAQVTRWNSYAVYNTPERRRRPRARAQTQRRAGRPDASRNRGICKNGQHPHDMRETGRRPRPAPEPHLVNCGSRHGVESSTR